MLLRDASHAVARGLLRLIANTRCAACGGGDAELGGAFCTGCGSPAPLPLLMLRGLPVLAAGNYTAPLSYAVQRFKFKGHFELARPLARLVEARLSELPIQTGDWWVPVPLHRSRLAERGYNQAALLAQHWSRTALGKFTPWALRKPYATALQSSSSREQRLHNLSRAFSSVDRVRGARVILVDDVITTGATLAACARTLSNAGANVVGAAALAVTP